MRFGIQQALLVGGGVALIALPALGLIDEVYSTTRRFSGERSHPMFTGWGFAILVLSVVRMVDRRAFLANGRSMVMRLGPEHLTGDNLPPALFRWLLHVDKDGRDRDATR